MRFPHGEPVEVYEAGAYEDPYNPDEPGEDWTSPTLLATVRGAFYQQQTGDRADDGRVVLRTRSALLLEEGSVPVEARHRIKFRGDWWQVDGDGWSPVNPFTGWAPGQVVSIEAVSG